MQYILTQEELDALKAAQAYTIKASKAKLQKLCTRIANEFPIKFWGRDESAPWGCILTAEDKGEEWYCDECVMHEICPHEHKEWSK